MPCSHLLNFHLLVDETFLNVFLQRANYTLRAYLLREEEVTLGIYSVCKELRRNTEIHLMGIFLFKLL